jgi:hypothetical protein
MASSAEIADVRTCVAAEQREGTPLYQQYEDYVGAVRSSRRNGRRNPVLGGPSLIDSRSMVVEKRYYTARPGR